MPIRHVVIAYFSEISRQDSHLLKIPLLRELHTQMDKLESLAYRGELNNDSIINFYNQLRNMTMGDASKFKTSKIYLTKSVQGVRELEHDLSY